ncbi:polymorphic toxin-type HINT domain-containing protein [Amycolatopsis sp. NPDC051371]|uniref:polymorphic toxin-type HINT domain-containing protein n=1 Tax=Amycolatopsis sp. NPDC051371 TaxID=3155800 RepID=UPI003440698C
MPQAAAAPRPALAASSATAAEAGPSDRAKVLFLWRLGGPATKRDAAAALTGTDIDVSRFLTEQKDPDAVIDRDVQVNQMMSAGGPSLRTAAQQALDANSDDAVQGFLTGGWQVPHGMDLNLRVNQAMSAGGPQLKKAAQQALDTNSQDALQAFLDTGWQVPFEIDQNLKVNQAMSAGGPEVKKVAQQALDANTLDALNQFLAVDLPVAQARDAETDSVAQLTAMAVAASKQATSETEQAKRQSDLAVTEAAAAQKAAQAAKDAAAAAQGHVGQATDAASRAAYAADQAAMTARQAIGAANAASSAAHTAAVAASRAAAAASQAGRAASRAYDAAALAIGDQGKAGDARLAAQIAHDAALSAQSARDAAGSARTASQQAETAGGLAKDAAAQSRTAADAATDAANSSAAAGADARQARAAAATARTQADRATAAANASQAWAHRSAEAAGQAAVAADAAANDALNAEKAALDAAAHAGHAADAAAQATAHANAATAAANAAVAAANQAGAIAQDARKADDDRITLAGQQADDAAKAALAEFAARLDPPRWDADQASTWDVETNRLITEARAAGATREVQVADGRQVALRLADSAAPWTRAASDSALSGTDDEAVDFVVTRLTAAAGQDDRAVLTQLGTTASGGFKTAITAALSGTDSAVRDFLRNRDYPDQSSDDSLQVNQIMSAARTAGRTIVVQEAQHALDANDDRALREFIDSGQYTALAIDEDLKVNQVMSAARAAGAREVVAAAQAALDGPPTLRHEFLTVGQYTAARRDQNTTAHNAAIDGLLAQATAAAATATHDANEAQAAAATARNAAQEADAYAKAATAAASQAETYASQARDAANEAAASAQRAQASANTAAAAARSARTSADQANRSAVWAQRSASDAAGYAADAAVSAGKAYDAAIQAGKDAHDAATLAQGAWQSVAAKVGTERQAAINDRTWECNNRPAWQAQDFSADDCIKLLSGTPEEQNRILNHLQDLCRQLNEPGTVELARCLDSRNLLSPDYLPGPSPTGDTPLGEGVAGLILAGLLALMCPQCELSSLLGDAESELGLLGGGRTLSAAMADALASGQGLIDVAGAEARIELGKATDLALAADRQQKDLAKIADQLTGRPRGCTPNSFAPDTPVLMADGTSKPIKDVVAGDRVTDAAPGSDLLQRHAVTAVHVTDDDNDFVDLSVKTPTGLRTITTTAHHLFWDATERAWRDAADLRPGELLATPGNGHAEVVANHRHPGALRTYNLAVETVHTYYVEAGGTPVLVHNAPCPKGFDYEAASASGQRAAKAGLKRVGFEYQKHMGRGELPVVPGKELDGAGQKLLDDILTDPNADYQAVTSGGFAGGFRIIGNEIVNGRFIGATFDSSGEFQYFGVYG